MIPPGLPPVHPFVGRDVAWLLDERARLRAAHPFLVWKPFDGRPVTITYGELGFRTRAIAGGLAARGVRAGERVLLHLDNGPEILLAWLACARLGAVAVTTNTRSAGPEVAYFADHAGAVAAITSPEHADLVTRHATGLRWTVVTGDASWRALVDGDPDAAPGRPIDPAAPISVMYTSGTTSRPKGVLWTHANALWGARTNAVHQDLRPDDVHLCVLPLFHTNALAYSSLATLWAGATVVLQPRFSASRFWSAALDHRCTWAIVTRFVWRALGAQDVPRDHHFRLWGNAWCEPPTDAEWGVKTIGWWGMTETISHGIVGDVHLPNRPLSMGRPAAGVRHRRASARRLVGRARRDRRPVRPRDPGAVAVRRLPRRPGGHRGRLHRRGLVRHRRPGDAARRRASCPSPTASRTCSRVGGENVAASEIERVIAAVAGVDEAAVVGQPHPMLDEVPVAFVIPAGGRAAAPPTLADDIGAACAAGLADFKRPRRVVLVDDLPRATLGKVAKNVLRTEAATLQ